MVAPSHVNLLHHPVRWRIMQSLINRELTTGELAVLLPDVAATTLYRHVATMADAGVLRVTGERRVRGAVERTYALDTSGSGSTDAPVDRDELRTMFTVYLAGLAADFERYLARDDIDPVRDRVAMRQTALWLSDGELEALTHRLSDVLGSLAEQEPVAGRTRRILSLILVPE